MTTPFKDELEFFQANKADLLKHYEGKFALVYGSALIGVWDSQASAYSNGIERFGNVRFLIKQILLEDPLESVPALFIGVL